MVGVASSKACLTCRRRRVGCDYARPNCGNCTSSNRVCEGYDKFPVFINRTISGLEKRRHLEEAKPRADVPAAETTSSTTASSSTSMSPTFQFAAPEHDTPSLWNDDMLSRFHQLFGWSDASHASRYMPRWLAMTLDAASLSHQRQATRGEDDVVLMSLKALIMTRLGRLDNNEELLTVGMNLYIQALGKLQGSMARSEDEEADDILVAGKMLLLHEVFESTSHSLEGWNTHASGVTRMIDLRGPDQMNTDVSKAVLEEHRYDSMIQSLHFRTRNLLGEPQWCSSSHFWQSHDDYQRLYDLGYDVGALAEDVDMLQATSTWQDAQSNTLHLLETCKRIHSGLEAWYEELSRLQNGPLYWTGSEQCSEDVAACPEIPDPVFEFSSLAMADKLTTFWCIRALLSVEVRKLLLYNSRLADLPGSALRSAIPEQTQTLPSNLTATEISPGQSAEDQSQQTVKYAILIARSASYCLSEAAGQNGPLQFLLPIRVACITFETAVTRLESRGEVPEAKLAIVRQYKTWCHHCFERVENEKKIGYARDLGKCPSLWQKA